MNSTEKRMTDDGRAVLLRSAASKGFAGIVWWMIQKEADVHAVNSAGETALHLAAKMGHDEIVVALIEAGADGNARDKNGVTPFQILEDS